MAKPMAWCSKGMRSHLALSLSSAILLTGCNTPSWHPFYMGPEERVTVKDVVNNINRQIACALVNTQLPVETGKTPTPEQKAWTEFSNSRSVAGVLLTLQVSQTQGLNPAVSFLTPYTPVAPSTMSSTSGAWSLGFQLDGTQQRQLTLAYVLDTEKILGKVKGTTSLAVNCDNKATPLLEPLTKRELEGDLGLKETVDAEVIGLGLTAGYGVSTPAAPPAGGAKSNSTSITFQSQFTVVEGINGGPNWKLMNFAGPAGGAVATAPSAGATGGAASANAGSPGNVGQLLNFNRSTLDQLVVTINPTCASGDENWAAQNACSTDDPKKAAQRQQAIG